MNKKIRIIKSIMVKSDGFTIDTEGRPANHRSGYYVSLSQTQNSTEKDLSTVLLAAETLGCYIGGWKDNERFYLDATVHIPELDKAVQFGRLNEQIAIWDIANNSEIRL